MSVAINLLSDARQAKIKAQHLRRLVLSLSVLVWVVVGGAVVLLLIGLGAQKLQLSSLNSQIASKTSQIQAKPHLGDALTAQQALKNLPQLYAQKSGFAQFLPKIAAAVPPDARLTSVSTDVSNTLTITGTASSGLAVDHFYENLKAAGASSPTGNYFTGVTINDVSFDNAGMATFTATAGVSTGVFDETK